MTIMILQLKESRLSRHINHQNYIHINMDIEDQKAVEELFNEHQFDSVAKFSSSGWCSLFYRKSTKIC